MKRTTTCHSKNFPSYFIVVVLILLAVSLSATVPAKVNQPNRDNSKKDTKTSILRIPQPEEIRAIVDSALIMVDDYSVALIQKPEFKDIRLSALRKFYDRQHPGVQDSITNKIYLMAADYLEEDKPERSEAFRECFTALARDTDPNLGPLYTMELIDAQLKGDTTSMHRYIGLLDNYAKLTNSDYDDELEEARGYINEIRTRKPIRDAIVGVWVSEDIAGFPNYEFEGTLNSRYSSPKDNKTEESALITTMPIIKVRDSSHSIYDFLTDSKDPYLKSSIASGDSIYKTTGKRGLDVIKSSEIIYTAPGSRYYRPIEAWELPGYGMEPLSEDYIANANADGLSPVNYLESKRHSKYTELFDNEYAAYVFWGDERLKRKDPEIAAIVRQSVQNMRAETAGALARSTVDFSTRLLGNMLADVGGAIIGGIIDALMVSTDRIWSIEATLNMVNPYEIDAVILAHSIVSKSNSNEPKVYDYVHKTKYYRWEPSDSVFFQSLYWLMGVDEVRGGIINLHQVSKAEEKAQKKFVKDFNKKFKKRYDEQMQEMKRKLKGLPKESEEYSQLKIRYDRWRKHQPRAAFGFNKHMLARLKAKSENYSNKKRVSN